MQLVPVPTRLDYLNATLSRWAPFLADIAKRSPFTVEDLLRKIHALEVQPVLVLDDAQNAVALLGLSICEENGERIAELVWPTGKQRHRWQHMLPELERYLREHVQCAKCRPVCRRGWKPFLEKHGYTFVRINEDKHVIMEKVLHG